MKGLQAAVCLQSLFFRMQLMLRVWKSLEFVKSEMDLTAMHRESCCKLYQLHHRSVRSVRLYSRCVEFNLSFMFSWKHLSHVLQVFDCSQIVLVGSSLEHSCIYKYSLYKYHTANLSRSILQRVSLLYC